MLIRLHKGHGKPDTLVCVRDDGSSTITRLNIPAAHDLCHYAVEKTLGFREAFYGLVAGGMDIADFNAPLASRSLPAEALHAEFIVGLFQLEMVNGKPYDDFRAELANACTTTGREPLPPPPAEMLSEGQVARVRETYGRLVHQWHALPDGETLELEF